MKTNRFIPLLTALSLAAFPTMGYAEKAKTAEGSLPSAKEAASAAPESPDIASAPWSEIKGYTYDQRDLFFAGLKGLEARVDALISELTAKRATMDANNTSTKEWDFAMQEMGRARTNLKSTSDDTAKATRESWDQQKDKVGLAWVRAQNAYTKVKSSTTN